jgi:hypothetical protein
LLKSPKVSPTAPIGTVFIGALHTVFNYSASPPRFLFCIARNELEWNRPALGVNFAHNQLKNGFFGNSLYGEGFHVSTLRHVLSFYSVRDTHFPNGLQAVLLDVVSFVAIFKIPGD